jgi:hypothetical protein
MFFLVWGRDERVRFFAQQLLPEAFDFPNRNFSSLASWGFSLSRFWLHQIGRKVVELRWRRVDTLVLPEFEIFT